MGEHDQEKPNRLEEIKSRLFSRNYKTEIEHRDIFIRPGRADVPGAWQENEATQNMENFFMKTSLFKKFFAFAVAFFLLAVVYAGYSFLGGGNTVSNDNIDISIIGNTFAAGGEELNLQAQIVNRNNSSLDLADLIVEYPRGSGEGEGEETERFRESLGTIPAGAIRNENIQVVLFGQTGSSRRIKISLEYRVDGSNAIFVKEKFYDVSISSTPVDLSVDAPGEVSPNQSVVFNIKINLNSAASASNILLKFNYPPGFQFEKSVPAPSFGNNVWNLGDLKPGVERGISVTGRMIDVFDGEEKTFHLAVGSQSTEDKAVIGVIFNSFSHTIAIRKPFVATELIVNGSAGREYAVDTKTPIRGEIRWLNNLDTKINNLEIRLKLSGNALDRRSVEVEDGRYDSLNDVIIWDKNYQSELQEVDPGGGGSVSFSLSSLPLLSSGEVVRDPLIRLEASVAGEQALADEMKSVNNSDTKTVRIISDIGFASKALHFSGPFQDTGPVPPRVEQETTYTIVWTLTNTANSISKTRVVSTLPPWARFLGPVSPAAENLTYNSGAKEIVWEVGNLNRGAGILGPGREVAFQVAIIPSLSQVGTAPTILNDAALTGHDDFANVNIRVNKSSLNTRLSNDPLFPPSGDRVVE